MKLVFFLENAAVGKMTVGQELMKITPLRLFHNHMTIEPVLEIFGTYHKEAITRLREVIFEEFASSGLYGLIFTFQWAFDDPADWEYVEHIKTIFRQRDPKTEFYYVELVAPQEIRLQRNATENRLKHKASKNYLDWSNRKLIEDDRNYRLESFDGELPFEHYLKIDNSHLPPDIAAQQIKAYFHL